MIGTDAEPKSAEFVNAGAEGAAQPERRRAWSLATLGVVFGSTGTTPRYALRQSLAGTNPLALHEKQCIGRALSRVGS